MTPPLSIYVLVEALGWELIKDRPFLDDVLVDRRWLVTVLGGSSATIPSILTGAYPGQHGHGNPLSAAPRVVRRAVEGRARPCPIDRTRQRDLYQPGTLDMPSIFDVFRRFEIPYESYTGSTYSDAEILALARARAETSDTRVLFLSLSGLEHSLHGNVLDAAGVAAHLDAYERRLRDLYGAAARSRADVRMFVFSDHGMTPVRWTYDLRRDVAALGLRVPDDCLPAYDATMARFRVENERARERLTAFLADHPCGQLLTSDELQRLGVWVDDGRYYHLVFLAPPGLLFCPSDVGSVRFAGVHGYHPSEPTADAVFLATSEIPKAVDHITRVHGAILGDLDLTAEG